MQVMYLVGAPRTKESLPDFLKWCRVTQHPLVFRGLTGSQRTPGNGASHIACSTASQYWNEAKEKGIHAINSQFITRKITFLN